MNRRQILLGFTTAVGLVTAAPAFAGLGLHGSAIAVGFQTLTVGAGWTGTGISGIPSTVALLADGTYNGTAYTKGQPLYATRQMALDIGGITVAAMPVIRWGSASHQRSNGLLPVKVFADAGGIGYRGISHVDFFAGDGSVLGTQQQIYTDQDANSNSRTQACWGVNIDCAGAVSRNANGAIFVYARAYPNDPTMTPRTIGPLVVYPRALNGTTGSLYDWDVTVNPSGSNTGSSSVATGNFKTLQAAMRGLSGALAGSFTSGRVTITSNAGDNGQGEYEWGTPSAFGFPYSFGSSCVTFASGVTAPIVRGATFDPADTGGESWNGSNSQPNAAWRAYSYVNNIEFKGSGVRIDRKNFSRFLPDNNATGQANNLDPITGEPLPGGAFFLNGCTLTNSQGAQPQIYWGRTAAPIFVFGESNTGKCLVWADGVTCEYQNGNLAMFDAHNTNVIGSGQIFCKSNNGYGSGHNGPQMVWGCFINNSPKSLTDLYVNKDTPQYTGPQYVGTAGDDATVNYSSAGAGSLIFTVLSGGSTLYTYTFNLTNPQVQPGKGLDPATDTFGTWAQIQAYLAASHPGDWSFTYATMSQNPYLIGNAQQIDPPLNTFPMHCKSSPAQIAASSGVHDEWVMWFTGPFENVMFCNNTCALTGYDTGGLNLSALGGNFRDVIIKNDTLDPGGGSLADHNYQNGCNPTGHHMVMENCAFWDKQFVRSAELDAYSSVVGVVSMSMQPATSYSDGPCVPANCVTANAPPAGNGNVNLNAGLVMDYVTQWTPLFTSIPLRNWTPAAGHALVTNAFTAVNPYDAQAARRGASDAAGAWKIGGTAPVWPF